MMQLYDITIAANTTRQLDAPGSYFYFYTGSAGGADSTITLRGLSSGLRIVLKPGQAFRLPVGQNETSWVITNYANAATIVGTVVVGDGDITDNRVTGSVEVIDGGKNRTMASMSFSGYCGSGASAGNFSHAQLWNPVGSGKNAVVEQIVATLNVTAGLFVKFYNTALTTQTQDPSSKKSGGSATSMQQRAQQNATILAGGFLNLAAFTLAGSTPITYKLAEPIVITPGYGLILVPSTQNVGVDANFEYFEESV